MPATVKLVATLAPSAGSVMVRAGAAMSVQGDYF